MAQLFDKIFDAWARRSPEYEKHYEAEVIRLFTDFGYGTNTASEAKGKILGAGYEVLIMAFFIGLYSNHKSPLSRDVERKDLGQPIQYWGNLDSKKGRRAYPRLKDYIFAALVARTPELDWLELEKGNKTPSECVSLLLCTMEEYINYGLEVIAEKLNQDSDYFYSKNSFIDLFRELTTPEKAEDVGRGNDDEPESLD